MSTYDGPADQGTDIIVSDGKIDIDVVAHDIPLIRNMIEYDPEVSWNGYSIVHGKSMEDVRKALGDEIDKGIGL